VKCCSFGSTDYNTHHPSQPTTEASLFTVKVLPLEGVLICWKKNESCRGKQESETSESKTTATHSVPIDKHYLFRYFTSAAHPHIMKSAFPLLLVALLAIMCANGSNAFVPNNGQTRERRPAFSAVESESNNKQQQQQPTVMGSSSVPIPAPSTMFALPPSAMAAALTAAYEEQQAEEGGDVSYGVALVSCVLSLALGFGIGYGV
jgi:hypothetical protein